MYNLGRTTGDIMGKITVIMNDIGNGKDFWKKMEK